MSNPILHKRININNICLHVAVSAPAAGENKRGKSVLCLHGFPEGWQGWRPLMREMPDVTFFAPDLRGYPPSDMPKDGYDVFTLTNDINQLIDQLGLEQPILLCHDWGGALGWIFAHRFATRISQLVVVNCPHPRTLIRAVLQGTDLQTLRIPWVPPFQIPYLPERFLTSQVGRKLLELSFTLRQGSRGHMDKDLVREIVHRFSHSDKLRGPVNYYREFIQTLLHKHSRDRLMKVLHQPIQVPVSLIWGMEDRALSAKVAQTSHLDAGCPVQWRPLTGIGHFVDLEASDLLARELYQLMSVSSKPRSSLDSALVAVAKEQW